MAEMLMESGGLTRTATNSLKALSAALTCQFRISACPHWALRQYRVSAVFRLPAEKVVDSRKIGPPAAAGIGQGKSNTVGWAVAQLSEQHHPTSA